MKRLMLLALLVVLALPRVLPAQFTLDPGAPRIVLDRGLVIEGASRAARRPINTDAVIAGLCDGTLDFDRVKAGDALAGASAWKAIEGKDGVLEPSQPGSYVLITVQCAAARIMTLDASGHAMVYVNGEPRVGDPYGQGYAALPVQLRAGRNTLLFAHAGRGGMKLALASPPAEVYFGERDVTAPEPWDGSAEEVWIGVPLVNATGAPHQVTIVARCGERTMESGPFTLPACTLTKVPIRAALAAPDASGARVVSLEARAEGLASARREIKLTVAKAGQPISRTFCSRVDGSVQYASIVRPADDAARPALVLSLHGASVEAISQARSYAPRPDTLIACPTNRRPYGFDWEDWGRIDAIECLEHVAAWYHTDPRRQYLTGHSMGGHGTWNLGVLYPERFAAIAPSAGWLSFDSYASAGGPPYAPENALGREFQNARASSMTLDFLANLRDKGIYILHGDADDNVPVAQARAAREALTKLGIPHRFHEQPGAGHWWDDDHGPGAACVDWPEIWTTFAGCSLPAGAKPAVPVPLDPRGFVQGSFKRVFDRAFVLVYGTSGSEAENAWSRAKARFDAEQWWYRGNGYAPVLSDSEYLRQPTHGNVILYGGADSNKAWSTLIAQDGPRVIRGEVALEGRRLQGDDLGCLLAIPHSQDPARLVGVVAGTGPAGRRAVERLNYFTSGVGFPDLVILRAGAWKQGFDGVEAAGRPGSVVWK